MTPEDIEFIRELSDSLNVNDLPNRWKNLAQVIVDGKRLLTLLVEAEARGDKTEWQWRHNDCYKSDAGTWFCRGPLVDALHDLTDSDWIKAVRERWKI